MLVIESTENHKGEVISHFEDEQGNMLDDLNMLDCLVIVFNSGSRVKLAQDWRGNECYLSQYELG